MSNDFVFVIYVTTYVCHVDTDRSFPAYCTRNRRALYEFSVCPPVCNLYIYRSYRSQNIIPSQYFVMSDISTTHILQIIGRLYP